MENQQNQQPNQQSHQPERTESPLPDFLKLNLEFVGTMFNNISDFTFSDAARLAFLFHGANTLDLSEEDKQEVIHQRDELCRKYEIIGGDERRDFNASVIMMMNMMDYPEQLWKPLLLGYLPPDIQQNLNPPPLLQPQPQPPQLPDSPLPTPVQSPQLPDSPVPFFNPPTFETVAPLQTPTKTPHRSTGVRELKALGLLIDN